jgi:hypothetical protein
MEEDFRSGRNVYSTDSLDDFFAKLKEW